MFYAWWTVWTAQSGEGIKLQFVREASAAGTTEVRADQITIAAIKLSDDLTEDTGSGGDWLTNEVTADTSLVTTGDSTTSNATITFTPAVASHDWLILSKSRITGTATTQSTGSRIVRSGEAATTTPFQQQEGEDATNDMMVFTLARVDTLGNASNTYTEKGFAVGGNNGTRKSSGIFALDLNKLRNHAFSYADDSVTALSATPYATNVATCSITPAVTGDVWSYAFFTIDINSAALSFQARLQIDDADQPPSQTTDAYLATDAWDTTDELQWHIQSIDSLASGSAHTVDLDASVETATAGRGARAKLVFAVTMELPAAANPINKIPTADVIGITDTPTRLTGKLQAPTADTVGITDTPTRFEAKTRTTAAETIGILEAITRLLAKIRVSDSDTVGISETTPHLKSIVRTDEENPNADYSGTDFLDTDYLTSNPTIAIYEQVLALLGKVRVPDADVIGITEAVIALLSKIQISDSDVVGISELVTAYMDKVRAPTTDIVGISETVSRLSDIVRVSDTDTVGISESISWLEGKVRVPDSDIVGISESISWLEGKVRLVPTDTVGITETVSRLSDTVRVPDTDTVGISESISWLEGKVRIPEDIDIIGISESVSQLLTTVQNLIIESAPTDTVGISESVSIFIQSTIVREVTDIIGISESVSISRVLIRHVEELISVSESVSRLENLVRIVSEQEGISEDTPHLKAITQLISDTVGITETTEVSLATPIQQEVTDTIGISEDVSAVLQLAPSGGIALPPMIKRRIAQRPYRHQRLIEPYREITKEQLEREKEKPEELELRTPVVSKLRFKYNIESSTVYQETKERHDSLAALSSKQQTANLINTEVYAYDYKRDHDTKPYQEYQQVKPITMATSVTPRTISSEVKQFVIDKPLEKYKCSSSLKFSYEIKDSILYNKLLKYAKLMDIIELVDILEEQEQQDTEEEIMVKV